MRKLLLVIIVIGVVLGYFALRDETKENAPAGSTVTTSDGFRPDFSNATFIFDEELVTLEDGRREKELAPGSAIKEEIALTDFTAYGDINNDKKIDATVIFIQSGGGSGVFIYLAGYVSGPVTYKGTNAIFIGDRITPKSVSIDKQAITLNYLDRKPDEPFAAEPTVPTAKSFEYRDGILIEK